MTQLLDTRTLQTVLKKLSLYSGPVDGVKGVGTRAAVGLLMDRIGEHTASWDMDRRELAAHQYALSILGFPPGQPDGLFGPNTKDALERYQNSIRDREPPAVSVVHQPIRWPREAGLVKFYGPVGMNQVSLALPYAMRIAWDKTKVVQKITCHKLVHDSLGAIFQKTVDHYGLQKIAELGLDMFGGCLNVRAKKGGRSYSTHSWGIAVDLDPERNQLRWGKDRAFLAKAEYEPFWSFVEDEGWISLGREKNYDWMHFQAARF